MRDPCRILIVSFLLVLGTIGPGVEPALGQPPPSTTCDGNENLTGADTTPQNLSLSLTLSDDFTWSGTCTATVAGSDHVTCFVPENDCLMNFDCANLPNIGATVAINVFSGSCATSPSSCLGTNSGTDVTGVSVSLTAGTEYCVVCETDSAAGTLRVDIDADSPGVCGVLPVQLQEFSVSGRGTAKGAETETETREDS